MSQTQQNKDRIRRADSWRDKGLVQNQHDEKFIFLWIAFNAAYGRELYDPDIYGSHANSEKKKLETFFQKIIAKDENSAIRDILWDRLSKCQADGQLYGPIPRLLDNQYVFRPFWDLVHGKKRDCDWREQFNDWNNAALTILRKSKVRAREWEIRRVLWEVFARLYTMRNQMFHGAFTYGKGKGRGQLEDGAEIMAVLVPAILEVMRADLDAHHWSSDTWEGVAFPWVDEDGRLIDAPDL